MDEVALADVHAGAATVKLLELDRLVPEELLVILVVKWLEILLLWDVVVWLVRPESVDARILVLEVVRLPVEQLKLTVGRIAFLVLERLQLLWVGLYVVVLVSRIAVPDWNWDAPRALDCDHAGRREPVLPGWVDRLPADSSLLRRAHALHTARAPLVRVWPEAEF